MKQRKAPKTGRGGPRRHSLKWSMIGMVLFCWILPVLLIVAGAGVYIFNSLATQAQKNLQMSAETATELVTTRMDAAMAPAGMGVQAAQQAHQALHGGGVAAQHTGAAQGVVRAQRRLRLGQQAQAQRGVVGCRRGGQLGAPPARG